MSDADVIRRAAYVLRKLAEQATPGPWEPGQPYALAGVMPERFGVGRCARCHDGEPTWVGRTDINGRRMLAHEHRATANWWGHGITAGEPGSRVLVVNDSDEYGYMAGGDRDYIATVHPGVGRALADALQQHADDHLSGVGCWVQCGILATARAILGETP